MKMKLLALIALTFGAQSMFGIDVTQYLNIDNLNKLTTSMPEFLMANKPVMTIIYDKYQPKAVAVYEYITTTPWTVDSASEKIAEEIASKILQNDLANKMLHEAYQVDIAPYANLLKMAKSELVGEAIENYAKSKGFSASDAKKLKDAIQDFAEWVTEFYKTTYKTHIKGKLDELFANKDVKAIAEKIKSLIHDTKARELVLNGLDKIDAHWPYIEKKLSNYGFDVNAFKGFKDKIFDALTNINEILNEQELAPSAQY